MDKKVLNPIWRYIPWHEYDKETMKVIPQPKSETHQNYLNYLKIEPFLEPKSQMFVRDELGFDEGGQVIGKPGGLVEPGVTHYGTSKVKTDKFKYKISNQFGTYYTDKPGVRIGEKPLTAAERMAKWREKNPYKKKTVDITIKGKKYTFTPPTGSVVQQGTKDLFKDLITGVEKWKEKPTTENWVNIFKEKKPSKIGKQQFQYGWSTHLRDYIQGKPVKSNIAKALFDQSDIKNLLNLDKDHVNLIKGYKNLQSPAMATKAAAEKLLWKSAEKVIAINNQFKQNPKITLEQLTKNLYKKEFTKAGKIDKLRLLTTVSDDVAKYLEALKNAREIPKGLKSQFSAPTGKNLDNIQKYITSQTEGFRFRDGTLRKYKYSIRDSILGFKQGYTKNLENKLKIKGVLDHAVGLSATHEVAPGYTGLYQDLENSLNKVKGTDIDRDFTKVLKEVIKDKNFKNVDAYNAQASKFHKKHKGKIDVPFIRQGGDPTKLVKSFYDLDEPSQKNILKLAEGPQGIAIETKGQSIKSFQNIFKAYRAQGIGKGCPVKRAEGGRIGFNEAGLVDDDCMRNAIQEHNKKLQSNDPNIRKNARSKQFKINQTNDMKNLLGAGLKGGKNFLKKIKGWGLELEPIFEGGFYEHYRRKGYKHDQALEETFFVKMLPKSWQESWFGTKTKTGLLEGAEPLLEKERYEIKDESGNVIGTRKGVKRYTDNTAAMRKIEQEHSNIDLQLSALQSGQREVKADAGTIEDLKNRQKELSNEWYELDRLTKEDTPDWQMHQAAVEKQQTEQGVRGLEYGEYGTGDTEKLAKQRERIRQREMTEKFPNYLKHDMDTMLEGFGLGLDEDILKYKKDLKKLEHIPYYFSDKYSTPATYESLNEYLKNRDKMAYFADNFRLEKANGGIASLTRTTPPTRGPQHMGLASFKKHGR